MLVVLTLGKMLMHSLTQSFLKLSRACKLELVVRSKNDFKFFNSNSSGENSYSYFNYDTYLSFSFVEDNERFSVWFSYSEMYELKKRVKALANQLDSKLDSLFKTNDDGSISICIEAKGAKKITGISDKSIFLSLAVITSESVGNAPGILLYIESKNNCVVLTVPKFLSFALLISELNLFQQGQLLSNSFLMNKLIALSNITSEDPQEYET